MSKGNMFLGHARGKVGDVVFSRQNGEQVTRTRNRHPKNPQTPLQLLQRVILKTTGAAYSAFREICDHSFQGLGTGTPNQSRFMQRNVEIFRNVLAEVINSGDTETILSDGHTNFNARNVMMPLVNEYLISEGTLPSINYSLEAADAALHFDMPAITVASESNIPSYKELVDGLKIQAGDQLTFIAILHDDTDDPNAMAAAITGFEYARVILDPASGDDTTPFLSAATAGAVNSPNEKNEGSVIFDAVEAFGLKHLRIKSINGFPIVKGLRNSVIGVAIIVSRNVGGVWQRSTEKIQLFDMEGGHEWDFEDQMLGDAIYSYMKGTDSSLYLNQAETGF